MFLFNGLTQINKIVPSDPGPGRLIECIHLKKMQQGLVYEGTKPFDVFNILVTSLHTTADLLNKLEEGDIIYINSGVMNSTSKVYNGYRNWRPILSVRIEDVTLVSRGTKPPEYEDHLSHTGGDNKLPNR